MKSSWFSAQYAENSTRDWEERMNAGAVREAKSPLKDAIDYMNERIFLHPVKDGAGHHTLRKDVHEPRLPAGTAPPSSSPGIVG